MATNHERPLGMATKNLNSGLMCTNRAPATTAAAVARSAYNATRPSKKLVPRPGEIDRQPRGALGLATKNFACDSMRIKGTPSPHWSDDIGGRKKSCERARFEFQTSRGIPPKLKPAGGGTKNTHCAKKPSAIRGIRQISSAEPGVQLRLGHPRRQPVKRGNGPGSPHTQTNRTRGEESGSGVRKNPARHAIQNFKQHGESCRSGSRYMTVL